MSIDHRKRALACMALPENSRCADCQAKDPRWASSKLGVFICINCSGRHRNLGTHITFVRSCTLDSWTDEQAKVMEQIGNQVSNAYWEARLPSDYPRPATDDLEGLTKFIRLKYELKKWADPSASPPHEVLAGGGQPRSKRVHRHRADPPAAPAPPALPPGHSPVTRSASEPQFVQSPQPAPQSAQWFAAAPPQQQQQRPQGGWPPPPQQQQQFGFGAAQQQQQRRQPQSTGGQFDFDLDPLVSFAAAPQAQQQQAAATDRAALKALLQAAPSGPGANASLREMLGGPAARPPPMAHGFPQQQQFGQPQRPPAKSASADPFGFPF
jgi:stromal membrane-associated protein